MRLASSDQMREMDRRAAEEFGVPTLELMERAGLAVTASIKEILGGQAVVHNARLLILCGKGNNGGDGLAAARLLRREGLEPDVWLVGRAQDLKGDARTSYERALAAGVRPREEVLPPSPDAEPAHSSEDLEAGALRGYDLIVDALLGTGLRSEVRGPLARVIRRVNAARAAGRSRGGRPRVLAVDVPSGLDSDTGQPLGACIEADATVTLGLAKLGLAFFPGRHLAGGLTVADIGIPAPLLEEGAPQVRFTTMEDAAGMLPPPDVASHKGSRGRVVVVAGSLGYTGAAVLAAESCMRTGAGLVVLACPEGLGDLLAAKVTEVIPRPVPQGQGRHFGPASCEGVLEELSRAQAAVVGPGLGRAPETGEFLERLLPQVRAPVILDADGLNHLAERGFALPTRCVLTPHPGEMSRLLGISTQEVQASRLEVAREAARRFGCVVLLKGADTVVAAPDGEAWVNSTGNPGLASAGTGDVLSGAIGALLGRGLAPLHAAVCGAFLHGLAADVVAEDLGVEGMMAGDVSRALPKALKRVRASQSTAGGA